jgi:hypothetical protein
MGLEKVPWYQKTLASGLVVWRTSHEICACCGIEFGRDDWTSGNLEQRAEAHRRWRVRWVKAGRRFLNEPKKPEHWNAEQNVL